MNTVSERIRWIYEQSGCDSMREFSRKAGLSEDHVEKILSRGTGERTGGDTLARIAAAGGVTLDWLVSGREPRTPVTVVPDSSRPLLGNARGWAEAEAAFRRRVGDKYPDKAYEIARQAASAHAPDPITEDYVGDVVTVLWKHHIDPSDAARQQKKLDAQIKGLRTKGERKLARQRAEAARANDAAPLALTPPTAPPPRKRGSRR